MIVASDLQANKKINMHDSVVLGGARINKKKEFQLQRKSIQSIVN